MSSKIRFIMSITRSLSSYHGSGVLSSNTLLLRHRGLTHSSRYRYLSDYTTMQYYTRNFSTYSSVQPGAPLPSQPPSSYKSWIIGIVLTIIFPFAGNKLAPLLQFQKEVDTTVETVEEIVEVIEKVAELVEKVAEKTSGDLPEGGKLKQVVEMLEHVAEQADKDAHAVGDAIDKFQELEEKVENIIGALNNEGNAHSKEVKNQK